MDVSPVPAVSPVPVVEETSMETHRKVIEIPKRKETDDKPIAEDDINVLSPEQDSFIRPVYKVEGKVTSSSKKAERVVKTNNFQT